MFDVSFTEMLVIAVVALVVIGPERLPKVARTVGHLLGRAQRYVSDVKGDIRREMELDELRTLRSEMEDAARTIKATVNTNVEELRKEFDETTRDVKELAQEAAKSATEATAAAQVAVEAAPHDAQAASAAGPSGDAAVPAPAVAAPIAAVSGASVDARQPVASSAPASMPASAPLATPDPVLSSPHLDAAPAPAVAAAEPVQVAHAELEPDPAQPSLFPNDVLPPPVRVPADTHQAAAFVARDSEKT